MTLAPVGLTPGLIASANRGTSRPPATAPTPTPWSSIRARPAVPVRPAARLSWRRHARRSRRLLPGHPRDAGRGRPSVLARPSPGTTGRVTVRGNFPGSCTVKFQDGQGQDWRILERGSVDVEGTYFDLWTLDFPANAASGPLRVLSPTNAEPSRTAPLDVREFRNTFGFSTVNGGPGTRTNSYSSADFERTFGTDYI